MHIDLSRDWELFLRILVGTLLGAIIGYERDIHGKPAGLRTHALVALASTTFMVVSTQFIYFQKYGREDLVAVDASRIAASVVSGIGFLAGGAILRSGLSVQGLTTAAGLWLVAAIGLASGGGMYAVAVVSTAIGVVALTVLLRFEDKQVVQQRVSIKLAGDGSRAATFLEELRGLGWKMSHLEYENQLTEQTLVLAFDVRFSSQREADGIVATIESKTGVQKVRITGAT